MAKNIKNIVINVNDDTLKMLLQKIAELESRVHFLEELNGLLK